MAVEKIGCVCRKFQSGALTRMEQFLETHVFVGIPAHPYRQLIGVPVSESRRNSKRGCIEILIVSGVGGIVGPTSGVPCNRNTGNAIEEENLNGRA